MAEETIFPVGENRDNLKLVAIDPSDTVASMVKKINDNFENIAAHGGGPAGIDGKDGIAGVPGSQGAPGKDGKDGKDGRDGTNGRDGRDGRDGTNGTDGSTGSGYTISYNSNAVIVCGDNWIAGDDNRSQRIEAPVKVYKDSIELKYGSDFSLKFKDNNNLPNCISQNSNTLICEPKANNTLTFVDGKPLNVEFTITIVGESMTFDCIWILTPIKGLISYELELSSLVVNAKYRNDDWNPVPSNIYVYVRKTSDVGSTRMIPSIFNNQGFAVYAKELESSNLIQEYFGFDKSNPTSNGWRGPIKTDNFDTKAYCTNLDGTNPTQAIGVVLLMNGTPIDCQDIKIVYDGTLGIPVNSVLPMSETYMYMVTKANAPKPQENDSEWKETSPVATDEKPWLWKKTTKVFGSNNVELYRFVSIDWIGSKGEPGVDADNKDYIYCRIDRELTEEELQHAEDFFPSLLYISAPLSQNNPFDSEGNPQWTDDDPGPNDKWSYVYYAVSEYDGETKTWGPYGHITFWNRYPKNTSNPYQLNLSNRIIEINCDEDNNTLYEKKIHENVTVLKEGPANIDYVGCKTSPTESRLIEIDASLAGIDITVPEGTNLEQPIELLVQVSNNWDIVDSTNRFYIEDTITIKKNSTRAGEDAVSYDIKSDSTAVAETDNGTFATGTFNNDIHIWVQKKVGKQPAENLTETNNDDNLTLEITYTNANEQTLSVGSQELKDFDYTINQEKLKTMRGVITCTLKQGDDVWDTHTIGISTRGPQGDPGTSTIGYSIIDTEAQYAVTTRNTPYTTATDKNISWAETYEPEAGKYIHKRYRHTLSDTVSTKKIPETGYYYEVIGYSSKGTPGEPGTTFYTWILYCKSEWGGANPQLSQTDATYKYKYSWYNVFTEPQPNNADATLVQIKAKFPAYSASVGDNAWYCNPIIIKEMISAGDTGDNIPTVFVGNWVSGQVYIGNDERRDIVWYTYMSSDKLVTKAYIAKIGAGRFTSTTPPNQDTTHWTEFGDVKDSIATKLLLAESANIAGFQFNRLYGQYVLRSQEGIGKTPTLSSDGTTYINNGEYTPNIYINGTRGIITAGATTTIDGNGLTIKNINGDVPQTVFKTDTNGNISMTGEINATGGVFNGDVQAKTFTLTPTNADSGMEDFRAYYKFESVNVDGKSVLCPVLYWTNPNDREHDWFLNLAAIKGLVQSSHYNYEDNWFRDGDSLLDENTSCLVPVDVYKNSDDDKYYILSGGEYKLANKTYYKQIDQPYGSRMAIVELENQYREWEEGSSAAYSIKSDYNGKVYLMIPINVYEQHTFSSGNDTYSSASPSYIFTSTAKFSINNMYGSSQYGRSYMKVEADYGQRNRIYFKQNYIYGGQAYNYFEIPSNSSLFIDISGNTYNINPSSSSITNPYISRSNAERYYALFQYGKGSAISDYKRLYTSDERCYYLDITYNAHSDER